LGCLDRLCFARPGEAVAFAASFYVFAKRLLQLFKVDLAVGDGLGERLGEPLEGFP
jgi:hypothetical protein